MPVVLADPAANAQTVVALARECHDEGVAVAVFPELCLSGYSIEDLLLQDTLLTAVHEAVGGDRRCVGRPAAGHRRRGAAAARHPAAQLRGRGQGRPDPGRRPQVLPAQLPRVLRTPPLRARRRPARPDDPRGGRRGAARPRPDLHRRRPARPPAPRRDLRGHVGPGAAERRGLPGGGDRALQPVQQSDHDRSRRGPADAGPQRQRTRQRGLHLLRRRPGGVDHRPRLGRPDDGLRVRRPAGGE